MQDSQLNLLEGIKQCIVAFLQVDQGNAFSGFENRSNVDTVYIDATLDHLYKLYF